ncbi:MAG: plastocyanin/azurin family copper-binding protein [Candidatus Nanohaloarchaea archaeon]
MVALIGVVLITSGCASSLDEEGSPDKAEEPPEEPEETNSNESQPEVDRTVEVTGFSDISYDTEQLDVEQGETVEFVYVNDGGTHDLVLEKDGEDVARTERLSSSGATDSFIYTFEEDGEYMFYCSVGRHRAAGMEGTINLT